MLEGLKPGVVTLTAETLMGGYTDTAIVEVIDATVSSSSIYFNASSFESTGNYDGDSFGGDVVGVGKSGDGINWVNRGDWVIYNLDIPKTGNYVVKYAISTPADDAEISVVLNGETVLRTTVENNGAWDSYYELLGDSTIHLPQGRTKIKIEASGENDWQWNLLNVKMYASIQEVEMKSIALDQSELHLEIGESYDLSYTYLPSNASETKVDWKSSDTDIASVYNGKVVGIGNGFATISVINQNNANVFDEIEVQVGQILHSTIDRKDVLYPNPVQDVLTIEKGNESIESIKVFSLSGELLLHSYETKNDKIQLNLSGLDKGVYLVRVIKSNSENIYKIIKD